MKFKIRNLKFYRIKTPTPNELTCNNCGKTDNGKGWLMADIDITPNDHFSITCCSLTCKNSFINHPGSPQYILNAIQEAKRVIDQTNHKNALEEFENVLKKAIKNIRQRS